MTHYRQTRNDYNDKYTHKGKDTRNSSVPVLIYIACNSLSLVHCPCPLEDKDKDKMTERPNLLYIFENVTTQGYQNGMVGESLVMHGG